MWLLKVRKPATRAMFGSTRLHGVLKPRNRRGTATVELALVLPVLLLLVLGALDLGRMFYADVSMTNAAWASAYVAANLQPLPQGSWCRADVLANPDLTVLECRDRSGANILSQQLRDRIVPAFRAARNDLQSLRDSPSMTDCGSALVRVCVEIKWISDNEVDPGATYTWRRSYGAVRVTAKHNFHALLPSLVRVSTITLLRSVVNHVRYNS
jgi:hypothetical protein